MIRNGVILAFILSALSVANAYRSQVNVTRDPSAAKQRRSTTVFLWDLAREYPNAISWADYLLSLDFDKPLTLRGLLAALVMAKFANKPVLRILGLAVVGAIPFIGYIIVAKQPIDLLRRVESFMSIWSIGIYSSVADLFHHVKPIKEKVGDDAVSKLAQHLKCEPSLPYYDPIEAFPRVLEQYSDTVVLQNPEPFAPGLFPQLCRGWGGLRPLQTPRTEIRNAMVSEMFNRLSANILVYSGDLDASKLFLVHVGEDTIRSVDEFVAKVPGMRVYFNKNSSAFGVTFCLKEADGYKQLPLAWPGRIAIRDPDNGNQLTASAYHSCLIVEGTKDCPLGEFRTQFFLGPEGITSWKAGNEFIRPWQPLTSSEALSAEEAREALRGSSCIACAINLASRTQDLAKGGYAMHGTCVDTTALLKMLVYGAHDDFPLVASGDARAGAIAACSRMAGQITEKEHLGWAKDMLEKLVVAITNVSDDTSIPPAEMLNAIDRFQKSVMGDFEITEKLKKDIPSLRAKWIKILSAN